MNIRIKPIFSRQTFNELAFIVSFVFYIIFSVLRQSFYLKYFPDSIFKVVILAAYAIMFTSEMLSNGYKSKEVAGIGILIILSLIMFNRSFLTMPLFIFVLCSRNVDFQKIAKYTSYAILLTMCFIIVSAYAGIIPNIVTKGIGINGELRVRCFMGFRYALNPSSIFFNAAALNLYAYKEKFSNLRYVVITAITVLIYKITDARLNFYLTVIIIFCFFVIEKYPDVLKKLKFIAFAMPFSAIVSSVFSFSMTIYYGHHNTNKLMMKLNKVLEERLKLGYEAFQKYPLKIVGNEITYVGNGLNADGQKIPGRYNYVDCFYENILLRFGVVVFIALIIMMTVTMFVLLKRKEYDLLTGFTIIAVHGMLDDAIINLQSNTFWLLMGVCLFSSVKCFNKSYLLPNVLKIKKKRLRFLL